MARVFRRSKLKYLKLAMNKQNKSKKLADKDDIMSAAREALDCALSISADIDISWIHPPPSAKGYTMAPDTLRFLGSIVNCLKPKHIIELGSGLSTILLARFCRNLDHECHISSCDHDPSYSKEAAQVFEGEPSSDKVKFQVAPLVVRQYADTALPVYHLSKDHFSSPLPADLIVIDGPPLSLGGREGTLYQMLDHCRPGTIVLLDDAGRKQEQQALQQWKLYLKDAIEVQQLPGFKRGLAAIIVKEPVASTDIRAYRLKQAVEDITRTTLPGSSIILVDDNQWPDNAIPDRRIIPFLEKNGQYWGSPPDDKTAIMELERLRDSGACSLIFAWQSFWWIDHYTQFYKSLESSFDCMLKTDDLVIFDLTKHHEASAGRDCS